MLEIDIIIETQRLAPWWFELTEEQRLLLNEEIESRVDDLTAEQARAIFDRWEAVAHDSGKLKRFHLIREILLSPGDA